MKRRSLTGGRAGGLVEALAHTRRIGPITFFYLLERYGSAGDALADLPALAKKAGGKADVRAPPIDEIKREIEATVKLGADHLAACEPDYSTCLSAIDAPPPVITVRAIDNC